MIMQSKTTNDNATAILFAKTEIIATADRTNSNPVYNSTAQKTQQKAMAINAVQKHEDIASKSIKTQDRR